MIPCIFCIFLLLQKCFSEIYTGHELWAVKMSDEIEIKVLKSVTMALKVDIWSKVIRENSSVLLHVTRNSKEGVAEALKEHGINYKVSIPDIESFINGQKSRRLNYNGDATNFNLEEYHDYFEIELFLQNLSLKHSNLIRKLSIGSTYENKSISGVAITRGNSGLKPALVYECGIHAREWISTAVCLFIIDQLILDSNSELTENFEFYIFPVINPDGYQYTWEKDRLWRKNRSKSSWAMFDHCIGVDLNRNFKTPYFCELGSSHNPCVDGYCGDNAFSEKETQSLMKFTLELGSRLKMYTSLHSFSQLWMYPYGYTNAPTPNQIDLHQLANLGAEAIKSISGTQYVVGPLHSTIYESSGSSVDWVYDTLHTLYAFILELPDEGDDGFLIPPEKIKSISTETWHGLKTVIKALP